MSSKHRRPESAEPADDLFMNVARTEEIPESQGRGFFLRGRAIAVFQDGGRFYAIDDFCPHQGAELHDGFVADQTVTCRHHGWRFSLETGCWLANKRNPLETYPVQVRGDDIFVSVPLEDKP